MQRIKHAFDPDRQARTGPAPAVSTPVTPKSTTPLDLDEDMLVACVACGLCLPHCPTYRVTGLEIASPRGRIAAMRAVESTGRADRRRRSCARWTSASQCRGCEAACPSGVQFGHLMEDTRAALAAAAASPFRDASRSGSRIASCCRATPLLLALTWCAARGASACTSSRSGSASRAPAAQSAAARRRRRRRTRRVAVHRLRHGRVDARHPSRDGPGDARGRRADRPTAGSRRRRVAARCTCTPAATTKHARSRDACMASMPGAAPIVVNSAGCGASMKEYGHLLGTPEARSVRGARRGLLRVGRRARAFPRRAPQDRVVVVQDPCHLRHVQKAHGAVRTVLGATYDLHDTDDEGLCCGAGGAYAALATRAVGSDPRPQGRRAPAGGRRYEAAQSSRRPTRAA